VKKQWSSCSVIFLTVCKQHSRNNLWSANTTNYSKILLIRHAREWTGAELSGIVAYRTEPI
jgi:hypothetical protein